MRKERMRTHRTPTQDFLSRTSGFQRRSWLKSQFYKASWNHDCKVESKQKPWLIATLQPAPHGLDAVGISKELQLLWGPGLSLMNPPPLPFIASNVPSNKTPPGSSKSRANERSYISFPHSLNWKVVHLTLSVMCEYPWTWIFEWKALHSSFPTSIQHRIYFQSIQ